MYLTVVQPSGTVTSLDLEHIGVFQVRIESTPTPGEEGKFSLALGIRYLSGTGANGTAFATMAAFSARCSQDELAPVLKVLLPADDRGAAKNRFMEAMKSLYNAALSAKSVDEMLPKGGALIDAYFDVKKALWGPECGLSQVGPVSKGSLEGYQWFITRKRFEGIFTEKVEGAASPPPPPGEEPETIVIPMEPSGKKRKRE